MSFVSCYDNNFTSIYNLVAQIRTQTHINDIHEKSYGGREDKKDFNNDFTFLYFFWLFRFVQYFEATDHKYRQKSKVAENWVIHKLYV